MGACFYPQKPKYSNVRGANNRGTYGQRPQAQPLRAPVNNYPPQGAQSGRYPAQLAPASGFQKQQAVGRSNPPQQAMGRNNPPQQAVVSNYPPQPTYPSQQRNNFGPSQGLASQQYAPQLHDISSREMINQSVYGPVHTAPSWNPSPTPYTSAQPLMGVQMSQPPPSQQIWNFSQPTVQSNILPQVNDSYGIPPAVNLPPVQTFELPQPQVIHHVPAQPQATCRMPALPPCKIDMGMGLPSVYPSMEVHNGTGPFVQEQIPAHTVYQ